MRFTVTPLGSSGSRSIDKVVAAIVDYLAVPQAASNSSPSDRDAGASSSGASSYYADGGDGPGRWLGAQAAASGLSGHVQAEDFSKVLAGRDPRTGERLISARGSAGRRSDLGAGTETKRDDAGRPLYDASDAATVLGVSVRESTRMLEVGALLAYGRIGDRDTDRDGSAQVTALREGPIPVPVPVASATDRDAPRDRPGEDQPERDAPGPSSDERYGTASEPHQGRVRDQIPEQPDGSYLVPVIDRDGTMWVTDVELARCESARAEGPDPSVIARGGDGDDSLPLSEAARLIGVTGRYLRRLAARWESQRDTVEATLAEGREVHQAWIPAHRGTRGRWFVRRDDLVEFVRRRRPPAVRVGYDVTLTTEKSLSVLALLSEPDIREAVLGAIRGGNDVALGWFEERAATTRVRGETVKGAGWTVASFQHLTSRALDPFTHHHNVVANTVVGPDGERRALDARDLYRHAQAASAIATVEMRHRLVELGIRWRMGATGSWEVDGIPDPVLRDFSRRRTEIDEALSELEEAIGRGAQPDDVDHIVLKTRPAKQHTPIDELLDGWWERARAHGFTPDDLSAITQQGPDRSQPADTTVFGVLAGADGVCATTSVFGRNELLHALAHLGIPDANGEVQPLTMAASDLQSLADRFLASPYVRQLTEPEGRDDARFTTVTALSIQERIVTRYTDGLCSRHGEIDPETIAGAITRHPKLSVEQRRLVRSFCLSGDQLQCAIGRAGAGKTTTMAAAVDAWQDAGFKVLGAAVKGEAARTLASATGITCETVAWHLAHTDPTSSPLDARTILVVDEASTISDVDLDRLGWLTEQTGATLRLIGDPAQHGAVAAGGMFRVLCEHDAGTTPELTESHRLQHPADRLAVDALRDGRIAEALDALQGAGHLHIARDDLDIYTAMLTRWWNAHQAGDHHPMVDRRNTTRHQLNRLAHRLLQANGEIGTEEIQATGDRAFSVGDRITARSPARHLHPDDDSASYVRNGATGTVTAIHPHRDRARDALTVDFDDLGSIELTRSFFDEHQGPDGQRVVGIDLAYSLTSYAVQGATFATSTSRIDEGANRPEAYVDTTRGRHANHLYLTRATDPLDGEHLPKAPPLPLTASITDRLAHSGPQPTAWELLQKQPERPPDVTTLEPER